MYTKQKPSLHIFAIIVMVVFTMALAPLAAFANFAINSEDLGSSNVGGITISGATVNSYEMEEETFTWSGHTNYKYTYNIVLSSQTALDETVTATFTKSGSAGQYCIISPVPPGQHPGVIDAHKRLDYNATLSNGSGSIVAYVHHDLQSQYGRCDTYTFNYTIDDINNEIIEGGVRLRFGDPLYPNTEPESLMSFENVQGMTFDAIYTGTPSDYYPDTLAFLAEAQTGTTIASLKGSGVQFATYDTNGDTTLWDTITPSQNVNNGVQSELYTLKIGENGGSVEINREGLVTHRLVINFAAPNSPPVGGGATPDSVNGYLPVGQFATGSGWGAIGTSSNSLDTPKFVDGYTATGVSLGMLGGYVQFDMGQGNEIINNPNNPYGVDFIVYGNAFHGNPEAGSVMVSEDGDDWYELAGSRYYNSDTNRNIDVTYIKMTEINTGLNSAFESAGVFASTDYTNSIPNATWERMSTNVNWWPEYASQNYGDVYNDGEVTTQGGIPYVDWDRTGNYELITFKNVTEVPDSNLNGEYQFGYFDITPNGNSYGNGVNPYQPYVSGKTGGDGYDLSWAVDLATGEPVEVDDVRYVRVYTSVLKDRGIFGEASAEVCGIYVAYPETSSVGTTSAPSITIGGETLEDLFFEEIVNIYAPANREVVEVDAAALTSLINSSTATVGATGATNMYINSTNGTSLDDVDLVAGNMVRIVAQSDTAAPYIVILKFI